MVYKKTVNVIEVTTDRYGGTMALVAVDKRLLNKEQAMAGIVWVYNRYFVLTIGETCKGLYLKARSIKRWLWSEPNSSTTLVLRLQRRK